MSKTWRQRFAPIVEDAIAKGMAAGLSGLALRQFVWDFYPCMSREGWAWEAWNEEVRFQVRGKSEARAVARPEDIPGQGLLWD
jgi:hypothetical protein